MIQANELRLGNLVNLRGHITEIQALKSDRCMALDDFAEYEDLEPIPLSEEWISNLNSLGRYNCNFHNPTKRWFLMIGDNIDVSDGFNHVHQLQNVYFALTNEELTIK